MNDLPFTGPRRVIPRWRDFRTTLETGELDSPARHVQRDDLTDPVFYQQKLDRWHKERSVEAAIDLVEAALVQGTTDDAQDAARLVLANTGKVATAVVQIAECAVGGKPVQQPSIFPQTELARQRVHDLRLAARDYPRNVFLWVDLARAYCVLGNNDQAERAIRTALAINPNDRFVLRSATRLLVHLGEPKAALRILRASERTRHDPWLLASEIATATLADAKQPNVTIARRALDSGKLDPFDGSELASAVGTLALHDGKITPGRKLLRQSLVDPTDNSVAQAQWANTVVQGIPIDPSAYALRLSYEARTQNAARQQLWADALLHCRNWCLDEPFSALPAIAGSYYAAVALQDHKSSEAFARQGLSSNPSNSLLLNNLAAALASQDRVVEAAEQLARISAAGRAEFEGTILATEGLIAMRKGDVDAGRQKYAQAIEVARRADPRLAFLALLHLAREELRHSTERAAAIIREVRPVDGAEPASQSLLVSLKTAAEKPSDKELLDRILDDASPS